MPELKLYNTLTNKKEIFIPIDKNNIRVYACGPTVYNYAHVGNARMAVVSDILVRFLRYKYSNVLYVSNITDIDDKIIETAEKKEKSISEISSYFGEVYNNDMSILGVLPPDIQPKATKYIKQMIQLIEKLIKNKNAYVSEGHVLFNVLSYKNYGILSGRRKEDQIAGSRVEVASYKKNPLDFVLWKPSLLKQPGWESPWGRGRPGWHIECSAMSEQTLSLPFDIHGGGSDLVFPHHENEIAQSCAANNLVDPKSYAKYWVHNGFVNVDGEKMSKSLGNIFLVKDILKDYQGEVIRYSLLSSHYRQPLNWKKSLLEQASKTLNKIYRILSKVDNNNLGEKKHDIPSEVIDSLSDDLNTAQALKEINAISDKLSKSKGDKKSEYRNQLLASSRLLGLLNKNPESWIKNEDSLDIDIKYIEELLKKRTVARNNKDFKLADDIRKELNNLGIEIEDNSSKTQWRKK